MVPIRFVIASSSQIRGTGRGTLIVAGVTNDVCTVYVVADTGDSTSKLAEDIALRRMEQVGAGITSANMVLTGIAGQWTSPARRSCPSSANSSRLDRHPAQEFR